MPSVVPINIFNIARTVVDREAVDKWLSFLGVEDFELPDDISDPALLVALAAKRCYKSFDTSLNPNLTKVRTDYAEYLDNILASGHGCYDAETDVLTSEGWKSWPSITGDEQLATLDGESGSLVYVKPTKIVNYKHTGKMYQVKTRGVDLLVTPNHRMYVCPTMTKVGRKRDNTSYSLISAQKLNLQPHAYKKDADWLFPSFHDRYSFNEMRLLGFSIGDGNYEGGNYVRFRLRKPRKIVWLRDLAKEMKLVLSESGDRYTLEIPQRFKQVMSDIYDGQREKRIPQYLLTTQSDETLFGLFEGLMESDGSQGETNDSFDTTSSTLVDQFSQLCLHIGLAANVCYTYTKEDRPTSFGNKPLTRLSIITRELRPEVNRNAKQVGRARWVENWEGEVYCAEMPENTRHVLYVRRNGQPVWCGNSVLEHSVYTFAFENVSRIFSAEMNRHRAGWAISEGSLRYIRFGEGIPYWLPTCLEADPKDNTDLAGRKARSREIFFEAFSDQENSYRELEDTWDMDEGNHNFHYKKTVTSMMRRIIGLGVATGGVWTGNIRALRHVLTMRCAPGAEEEILHVFSRVAMIMKINEPLMFGDFEIVNGFWRPKYVKV